jgi:hypothetical protein
VFSTIFPRRARETGDASHVELLAGLVYRSAVPLDGDDVVPDEFEDVLDSHVQRSKRPHLATLLRRRASITGRFADLATVGP